MFCTKLDVTKFKVNDVTGLIVPKLVLLIES